MNINDTYALPIEDDHPQMNAVTDGGTILDAAELPQIQERRPRRLPRLPRLPRKWILPIATLLVTVAAIASLVVMWSAAADHIYTTSVVASYITPGGEVYKATTEITLWDPGTPEDPTDDIIILQG